MKYTNKLCIQIESNKGDFMETISSAVTHSHTRRGLRSLFFFMITVSHAIIFNFEEERQGFMSKLLLKNVLNNKNDISL
jgi:hypothetical protein